MITETKNYEVQPANPKVVFSIPQDRSQHPKSLSFPPVLQDLRPIYDHLKGLGLKTKEERWDDGKLVSFKTQCPHPQHGDDGVDEDPSLQVSLFDGKVAVRCWVCEDEKQKEIWKLFWQRLNPQPKPTSPTSLEEFTPEATITTYEVKEKDGTLVAIHQRIDFPDGRKEFVWVRPDGTKGLNGKPVSDFPLYSINKLQPNTDVVIVEGEKSCEALWSIGIPSVATYGSQIIPTPRRLRELVEIVGDGRIYLWADNDPEGRKHMERIAQILLDEVGYDNLWFVSWKDAPEKGDAADAVGLGVDVRMLLQTAKPLIPQGLTSAQLTQHLERSGAEWMIEGLMAKGEICVLSARPKTAKSLIALNVAACVAEGKPFIDFPTKQGKVFFLPFERMELTLQRIHNLGIQDNPNLCLWDITHSPMPRIDRLEILERFIKKWGISLVVIDTLSHFLRPALERERGNLNAYDLVYGLFERIKDVAERSGCCFLFVHHDRKGDTDDERGVLGSTAITGAVDVILQLKSEGQGVIKVAIKGNRVEDQTVFITIGEDGWVDLTDQPETTEEEKARKILLRELLEKGQLKRLDAIKTLMVELGKKSETSARGLAQRTLKGLVDEGLVETPKKGLYVLTDEGRAEAVAVGRVKRKPKTQPQPSAPSPQNDTKTSLIENVSCVSSQNDTNDTNPIGDVFVSFPETPPEVCLSEEWFAIQPPEAAPIPQNDTNDTHDTNDTNPKGDVFVSFPTPTPSPEGDNDKGGDGGSPQETPEAGLSQSPPMETPEAGDRNHPETPPEGLSVPNCPPFTGKSPEGIVTLKVGGEWETLTPDDLDGWQGWDDIEGVSPPTEFKPIPPAIVIDLECEGIKRDGDGNLDLTSGNLLAVGLLFAKDGQVETKILRVDECGGERGLLETAFREITAFANQNPHSIITGYNLMEFDLPYLINKAETHNVPCPF